MRSQTHTHTHTFYLCVTCHMHLDHSHGLLCRLWAPPLFIEAYLPTSTPSLLLPSLSSPCTFMQSTDICPYPSTLSSCWGDNRRFHYCEVCLHHLAGTRLPFHQEGQIWCRPWKHQQTLQCTLLSFPLSPPPLVPTPEYFVWVDIILMVWASYQARSRDSSD